MRHNAFAVRQRGARGPAYNDAVTQASVYAGELVDDVKGLNVLMLPAGTTAVLDGDGASMGFTIAAGQSGGTAQLIAYPLKDSRTIKDLEGKTIRILARYWASTNFLFLKPLEPNYVDIGRFQGVLGGALVSQSQVGNILTRIVEYTVVGTEDYLGIIAQVVAGAASTGAAVTLKLVGLSYSVVGESAVTVDKAIGAKSAERFGLSLAGDFQNGIGQKGSGPIDGTVTILRDPTTGYANGLRVLAGNTGAGNTMSVFTLVAPEDFALVRGARARVTVVLKTSAVFNRKLDILVGGHVRATGGGPLNEYRAMAQHVYPGRLVAVVEGIFDAGTEQITVTANNISTTNAAADQDWQFEDVRVEIVATAEGSLTGAQATMALQRNFWARRRQRPVGQQVSVAISGGDFTNFYTTFANVVAYQDINLAADGGAYVFTTSTEETRPLFPPFANAIVRGVGATRPVIRLRQPTGTSLSDVANNSASDFHHSGEFYNLDIGAGGARYAIHSDDGANHYYNQKMVFRRITATHEGNDAISGGWRNCAALGFGLTTGSSKDFIACTFRGYDFSAVIGHGDANATAPGAARFIDSSMTPQAKVGTTSLNLDGFYYAVASSGHCDDIEITGTNPNGPVTIGSAFWAQTDPAKIPAFKMNINVHGHANAEFPYVLQDDGSRALRITSASTGASSAVAISGTAANKLFATSSKRTTQAGATGVSAFVTGWFDVGNHNVGPASDQDVVQIDKRLAAGDVLTVTIDGGTAVNVTFTSGMTSDQFMTALNAALGATASAVLFNVNDLYRPEFPTEEHRVCNATSATIPRKTALCWTSAGRPFVRVMTPSDPITSFAGICYGNDILPGLYGRAKASGQVRVTMDLLRSDAVAFKAGDVFVVSTNDGKVAVGSGPGIFVAINEKDVRVGTAAAAPSYLLSNTSLEEAFRAALWQFQGDMAVSGETPVVATESGYILVSSVPKDPDELAFRTSMWTFAGDLSAGDTAPIIASESGLILLSATSSSAATSAPAEIEIATDDGQSQSVGQAGTDRTVVYGNAVRQDMLTLCRGTEANQWTGNPLSGTSVQLDGGTITSIGPLLPQIGSTNTHGTGAAEAFVRAMLRGTEKTYALWCNGEGGQPIENLLPSPPTGNYAFANYVTRLTRAQALKASSTRLVHRWSIMAQGESNAGDVDLGSKHDQYRAAQEVQARAILGQTEVLRMISTQPSSFTVATSGIGARSILQYALDHQAEALFFCGGPTYQYPWWAGDYLHNQSIGHAMRGETARGVRRRVEEEGFYLPLHVVSASITDENQITAILSEPAVLDTTDANVGAIENYGVTLGTGTISSVEINNGTELVITTAAAASGAGTINIAMVSHTNGSSRMASTIPRSNIRAQRLLGTFSWGGPIKAWACHQSIAL